MATRLEGPSSSPLPTLPCVLILCTIGTGRPCAALHSHPCAPPKARHASRALPEHSTPTSAVLRKPSAPGAMQGAISLLTSMANSSPAPSAKLALSPIPLGNRHAVPVLSANMQRQMAKQSATRVPSAHPIHSRARPHQVSRVSPSHSACLCNACSHGWRHSS